MKSVQRARDWVKEEIAAVSPETVETFDDAWGQMTAKIGGDVLNDDHSLRDRTQAYKAVGQATQALPDRVRGNGRVNIEQVNVVAGDKALAFLDGFDNYTYLKHDVVEADWEEGRQPGTTEGGKVRPGVHRDVSEDEKEQTAEENDDPSPTLEDGGV
jgi:hypothetical protein